MGWVTAIKDFGGGRANPVAWPQRQGETMTPRERAIEALELRRPPGLVPHLELEYHWDLATYSGVKKG
jgi:hypothetical protein